MKQLIYSGPSQGRADSLHWDEVAYTDTTRQTTIYDDLGQKTYIQNITGTSTGIAYDVDGHIANPDEMSTNDPLLFKEQQITYNSLNRVDYYRLDNNELRFDYRPDTTKWRTRYYEDGSLQYTKYHFGNHEKIEYANGICKNLFYIFGGKELTGIYIDQNGNGQMGYTITDHLGSIWALADKNGGFIEKYAYNPWGRRVNPDDWCLVDNRNTFITDRGFTLHEHYDQMQVINMVARLYDPILGQFISVDPMADLYPGWAPYVYCYNNPLVFVDPTGEIIEFADWESVALFDDLMYLLNEMENDLYDQMEGMEDGKELDALQDKLTEVQDALCEIQMMDLDDNVFLISTGNGSDNGGFGYSGEGNVFDVVINNSSVATLGHELKHGFQYLEGKIDFRYNKQDKTYVRGNLSGIEDEFAAFRRGEILGGPKHSESEIRAAYEAKGYTDGSADLKDRNEKQLERYKEKAGKVINGNKNYKFNFGYENY